MDAQLTTKPTSGVQFPTAALANDIQGRCGLQLPKDIPRIVEVSLASAPVSTACFMNQTTYRFTKDVRTSRFSQVVD
jgi:hypothetical protein